MREVIGLLIGCAISLYAVWHSYQSQDMLELILSVVLVMIFVFITISAAVHTMNEKDSG